MERRKKCGHFVDEQSPGEAKRAVISQSTGFKDERDLQEHLEEALELSGFRA